MKNRLIALIIATAMLMSSTAFATIYIPKNTTRIEAEAFAGDRSIDGSVELPDGIAEIGERAFADTNIKEIALPATLTSIADDILEGDTQLETIGVTRGSYAERWAIDNGYRAADFELDKSVSVEAVKTGFRTAGCFVAPEKGNYEFVTNSDGVYATDVRTANVQLDGLSGTGELRQLMSLNAGEIAEFAVSVPVGETIRPIEMKVQQASVIPLQLGANDIVTDQNDQSVRYGYTVTTDGHYTLSAWGSSLGYVAELYRNGEKLTSNSSTSSFALGGYFHKGDQLTLAVWHTAEAGTNEMVMKVEFEPMQLLHVGENEIKVSRGNQLYYFEVPYPGRFTFYTEGDVDTVGCLLDESGKILSSNDDIDPSEGNYNFSVSALLLEGAVYLNAYTYDNEEYTVTLMITGKEYVEPSKGDIYLGENALELSWETTTYYFDAPYTGEFEFYTVGDEDTVGCLKDANGNELDSGDDIDYDGGNCNFSVSAMIDEGSRVYLEAYRYGLMEPSIVMLMVKGKERIDLSLGENEVTMSEGTANAYFTPEQEGMYTFNCTDTSVSCTIYDAGNGTIAETMQPLNAEVYLAEGQSAKLQFKSSNLATRTINVTVGFEAFEQSDVTYRALLIGEVNFNPVCRRNGDDVKHMHSMLDSVNGGAYRVAERIDLSKSGVKRAIGEVFKDADENDVSLFFYASHGSIQPEDEVGSDWYGYMATYNGEAILTKELAQWLSEVPGKVIVIIGTCGSGAVIEPNAAGIDGFPYKNANEVADALGRDIIDAFAAADPGLTIMQARGAVQNKGELRTSKFEVMTAALGGESSWGYEPGGNAFVDWIVDGVGTSGSMNADSNRNSELTTAELYAYVKAIAAKTWFNGTAQQHPQVYPENSDYVLFRR